MQRVTGPTPDQHRLTARETEILALVASGMSNTDIATSTGVSINSVKSFIRSAYRKIGAEKRAEAIAWFTEHGPGPHVAVAEAG